MAAIPPEDTGSTRPACFGAHWIIASDCQTGHDAHSGLGMLKGEH